MKLTLDPGSLVWESGVPHTAADGLTHGPALLLRARLDGGERECRLGLGHGLPWLGLVRVRVRVRVGVRVRG